MNKFRYFLIPLLLSFCDLSGITLISNSTAAKNAISTLEQINEFNFLIKEIEKEGVVKIEMQNLPGEQFDAFWDSSNRIIRINLLKNEKLDTLIVSILFELHNAKSDKRFKQLYTMARAGQISKEKYVEGVERMEHQNALNTSILIEKGIRLGIIAKEASWPILRSFDDHYKLQQIKEHSHWIAKNYDQMSPYRGQEVYIGTLPKVMTEHDKNDMIRYLKIKNDIEGISEVQSLKGVADLKKEYETLENCYLGVSSSNCRRYDERIELLGDVFKENSEFQTLIKNSPIHLIVKARAQ